MNEQAPNMGDRNHLQPPSSDYDAQTAHHEQDAAEREAYEYWGYLFKPDKTGTDKLKSLLRGLKEVMNTHYEPPTSPSQTQPDLTPTQLATFYRSLNGNYDRLFLGTPSDSLAFIYKSLGCLYSLQPLAHSTTAFTEPTIPCLKTEGWIMWQTIQLLLGPEEHSGFLREAVREWDVRDPETKERFPSILPRACFPAEPDRHMVAWYEGVSERLRREAEDEEREAEQAEVRRLHYRKRGDDTTNNTNNDDGEGAGGVGDSRRSALAYFRDPLYRQDGHYGRPGIVNRNTRASSKQRPQLSPRRPSMKDRAKEGATSVGHVIRNIGSPHLWDGRGHGKSESRDRSKDYRRRSLPEHQVQHQTQGRDGLVHHASRESRGSANALGPQGRSRSSHQRHLSGQQQQGEFERDYAGEDDTEPIHSNRQSYQSQSQEDPSHRYTESQSQSRDADPEGPQQREITDYFANMPSKPTPTSAHATNDAAGHASNDRDVNEDNDNDIDDWERDDSNPENEDEDEEAEEGEHHALTPNNLGPSFGPSISPLFASQVAKQPQPQFPHRPQPPVGLERSAGYGQGPPRGRQSQGEGGAQGQGQGQGTNQGRDQGQDQGQGRGGPPRDRRGSNPRNDQRTGGEGNGRDDRRSSRPSDDRHRHENQDRYRDRHHDRNRNDSRRDERSDRPRSHHHHERDRDHDRRDSNRNQHHSTDQRRRSNRSLDRDPDRSRNDRDRDRNSRQNPPPSGSESHRSSRGSQSQQRPPYPTSERRDRMPSMPSIPSDNQRPKSSSSLGRERRPGRLTGHGGGSGVEPRNPGVGEQEVQDQTSDLRDAEEGRGGSGEAEGSASGSGTGSGGGGSAAGAKHARFAPPVVGGVDGRRYPNEAPWGSGG